VIEGLDSALRGSGQPGLAELRGALLELLDAPWMTGRLTSQRCLKVEKVYRLGFEVDGQARSLVIKRMNLPRAVRNQLAVTRWLPAGDLGGVGPVLLGVAAERNADGVWHVYQDLGDRTLDTVNPVRSRVEAAIDLIASLHVRFAEHPLLPECRMYGKDMGMTYYLTNIRDAIRGLESLQPPAVHAGPGDLALRDRLLRRLHKLLDEGPDRARVMAEGGGPETLLHGDLWPENVLAVPTPDGLSTRLIDWDATGVGPLTYDLSTFLYRFSAHHRPWILDRYQQAVAPLGWHAPATRDLSLLLETAEISRIANCIIWPCIEAVQARADWAFDKLADIETWFDSVEPALTSAGTPPGAPA
jgi:aminoglycoside/choline kinase family phosphotransferase